MGTVKPVPHLELAELLKEGYHPTTYVKTVPSSAERGMTTISELRKKNPESYDKFNNAVNAFASAPCNNLSSEAKAAAIKAKNLLFNILPKYKTKLGKESSLHFCGSLITGCSSQRADVDLCWAIPVDCEIEEDVPYPMKQQDAFVPDWILRQAKVKMEDLPNVTYSKTVAARVQIIKFNMEVDGIILECDMNINNTAGIHNSFLLAHYSKIDARFPALARILKHWGKKAEIIDSQKGYLNSYTMTLMVIHFLQCGVSPPILPNLIALRPDLFDGNLGLNILEDSYALDLKIEMEKNETPLGDLLIGFLRYYGLFRYECEGIYLRLGCVGDKPNDKDEFFLEEVYDRYTVPKNLTAPRMDFVKCTFIDAYMKQHSSPNFSALMSNEKSFMIPADIKNHIRNQKQNAAAAAAAAAAKT